MSDKLNKMILYVGTDNNFWESIRFVYTKTYPHVSFGWHHLGRDGKLELIEIVPKILAMHPMVIYFDFSKHKDEIGNVCSFLSKLDSSRGTIKVGLIDKVGNANLCWASGADLFYVKSGEHHDLIYHPFKMHNPRQAEKPDFALARLKKEYSLIEDMRMSFVAKEYIRAEGNFALQKGQLVQLENNIPEDMVPSKQYFVKAIHQQDLQYDFKYGIDLGFTYVDRPEFDRTAYDEAMKIDDAREREKVILALKQRQKEELGDFDFRLKACQKKVHEWVHFNAGEHNQRKPKVMVIDQSMTILKAFTKKMVDYPVTFHCQTHFNIESEINEIKRVLPELIAMKYLDESVYLNENGEKEEDTNKIQENIKKSESLATRQIEYIVRKIKEIKDYRPILIVFQCQNYSSKAFQDTFEYSLIMTNPDSMNLDSILQMVTIYEKKKKDKFDKDIGDKIAALRKKDPAKYGRLTKADFVESQYNIKPKEALSFLSISHNITITMLTESEVVFLCNDELTFGNYRLLLPFQMYFRIIPQDGKLNFKEAGSFRYQALIHGIGETEKKELRRYVNEIFSAFKIEERAKEELAFKELNAQKAQERTGDEEEEEPPKTGTDN